MADLSITAANVFKGDGATTEQGLSGEAFEAGDVLYKDATTSKWMKGDNTTATKAACTGMALNTAAAANQPCVVQTGGEITLGTVLTKGLLYVVGATAGQISPASDLGTGEFSTFVGVAESTSSLKLGFLASGVALD
jgi:hypothetical protein